METEEQLLDWLRQRQKRRGGGNLMGDDAAILPPGEPWAVTTDTQIEGVHFYPGLDPAVLARRLLAVNLSDLAAMGATPALAFLVLAAPPAFEYQQFLKAFQDACHEEKVTLAGGDLSSAPQLTLVATLFGRQEPGQEWLRRSAAEIGDRLWLGGTLGESAAGRLLLADETSWRRGDITLPSNFPEAPELRLAARDAVKRHLEPRPQIALGQWLASHGGKTGIDVSDGLARDLHRLCRESRVGAEVDLECLPKPCQLMELSRWLGVSEESLLLAGGEDYILLFTLPPHASPPESFACHAVGKITREHDVLVRNEQATRPLPLSGWDHLEESGNGSTTP